jgi:hypothetical protein
MKYSDDLSITQLQVDRIDARLGILIVIILLVALISSLILSPSSSQLMAQENNHANIDGLRSSNNYDTARISNVSTATSIVAYNSDLGLIQEKRLINNLSSGLNSIIFENIAPSIEPTSVYLNFSGDYRNCCIVEEQIFEYDILNLQLILEKLLGEEITIYVGEILEIESDQDKVSGANHNNYSSSLSLALSDASLDDHNTSSSSSSSSSSPLSPITGKLLAFEENNIILLDTMEKQIKVLPAETIKLISLPTSALSEFVIKPSLVWKIRNDNQINSSMPTFASHDNVEALLSYLTRGINWNADYIAILDKDESNLSIQGWITLDNQAGIAFKNFALKLVAGDVNLESSELYPSQYRYDEDSAEMAVPAPSAAPAQEEQSTVSERQFFDYHLYSVNGTIDEINDKQTKQIKLFDSENVKINKTYTYDISADIFDVEDTIPISISISFNNTKDNNNNNNGLGIPLPSGIMRIYKQYDYQKEMNEDLIFIGEDSISHTPTNENITLNVGNAFDIVGETILVSETNPSDEINIKTYNVTLKNRSNQSATVLVNVGNLHDDWTILDNTVPFVRKDASTVQFPVPVQSNSQTSIVYRIQTISQVE